MSTDHISPSSPWRAIAETALYANSVRRATLAGLYEAALHQPEVVATDEPMYHPEMLGLPSGARVLVSNDGSVIGRTDALRVLTRKLGGHESELYQSILREAARGLTSAPALCLEGVVGLHADFMVRAHVLGPEGAAKSILDWGLNFHAFDGPLAGLYGNSRPLDEPDMVILLHPEWRSAEHPAGAIIIDEATNTAALLGIRYFGELRKATLTLAWAMGVRHNMAACHGGLKTIAGRTPVAVFGMTGSGKSAITTSLDHGGLLGQDEEVTVIHDDAFLVDLEEDYSVALEPSFFATAVSLPEEGREHVYSAQNMAVTTAPDGRRVLVSGDARNPNGRYIKGRDALRGAGHSARPGMVVLLQQDTSLPPICRVNGSALSVAMGASLATTLMSPAGRFVQGSPEEQHGEPGSLVIEPFANPYRVHPLLLDCEQFRKLFRTGCECHVINTFAFGTPGSLSEIPHELVLAVLTELVRGRIQWREWRTFHGLFVPRNGAELFGADYDKKFRPRRTKRYMRFLRDRLQDRITFLSNKRDRERDMSNSFIAPLVAARNTIDRIIEPDLYG